MLNPNEDILTKELSNEDVWYILDITCKPYIHVRDVRINKDSVELIGFDGKHAFREMSFLYNSGRVVSIQRRLT